MSFLNLQIIREHKRFTTSVYLIAGPPEQEGQSGRLPLPQSFLKMCPFFEEPFKCVVFENIKSEIVNIR